MPFRHRHIDLDPLPAFGSNLFRFDLQLLGSEAVEQSDILQPAAIVLLEEIAHDDTANLLISRETDKEGPFVRSADGTLRQHAPDLVRLLAIRALQRLPDLLLARMIGRHREKQ